jgi:Flp pilus assembly protein TadG
MNAKLTHFQRPSSASLPAPGAFRRFATDKTGSTIVEFAMIALPLFFMIIGIIEIGYGNFTQYRLDAAVQSTARLIMTGVVQNTQSNGQPLTAQQFRDQVLCPKLPASVSCNDVYVNIQVFSAPTTLTAPSPYVQFINASGTGLVTPALDNTRNSYCIGAGASYVIVDVVYPLPLVATSYLSPDAITYKGAKARLLQSAATFRNEPFSVNSATQGC